MSTSQNNPERELSSSQATDDELAAFKNSDAQREIDLQEFMQGEQISHGGRHDLRSRGLTTATQGELEQGLLEADPAAQRTNPLMDERQFVQDAPPSPQPQVQREEQDFRVLYGRSENEKGELRRALSALEEQNVFLQQALTQQVNQPTSATQYPVYQQPQVQQAPPQQVQLPRLVDKPDGEMMLAEDVERVLRERVAPFVMGLQAQVESTSQNFHSYIQRQLDAQKAQSGITPVIEAKLVAKYPYLNSIADPQARLSALINHARSEMALTALQRTRPAPVSAPAQAGQAGAATRRITYVEPSAGATTPDQTANSRELQFQQEWAKASSLPWNQRAQAQRQVLEKFGVGRVSGFREPNILTR